MRNQLLILTCFVLVLASCVGHARNRQAQQVIVGDEKNAAYPTEALYFEMTVCADTDSIVIDRPYLERRDSANFVRHAAAEYEKYGLTKLNTLGMSYEGSFRHDDIYVSFHVSEQIELYPDIRSLVIRGESENSLGIWLVNYDAQHNYIDSFPVGYDEWAESASVITSVIYLGSEPYIEQEWVNWEEQKKNHTEIERSGKFKITRTVKSTYDMSAAQGYCNVEIIPPNGTYRFDTAFAECRGRSMTEDEVVGYFDTFRKLLLAADIEQLAGLVHFPVEGDYSWEQPDETGVLKRHFNPYRTKVAFIADYSRLFGSDMPNLLLNDGSGTATVGGKIAEAMAAINIREQIHFGVSCKEIGNDIGERGIIYRFRKVCENIKLVAIQFIG